MIVISHRGNISGPYPALENHPDQIRQALTQGFQAEIDVWYEDGQFALGHDEPQHPIPAEFLSKRGLWCHAKNLEAVEALAQLNGVHFFWHQTDSITLTNWAVPWCFPGQYVNGGITVLTKRREKWPVHTRLLGICTDWPEDYKYAV